MVRSDTPARRTSRRAFVVGALALIVPAKALAGARAPNTTGPLESSPAGRADDLFTRDEPLLGSRSLQAGFRVLEPRNAPRFSLVGVHWRGDGEVFYQVAGADKEFGGWHRAECCEQPDKGAGEPGPGPDWHFGKPTWVGDARWIQYRVRGDVRRLRAHYLWSEPRSIVRRRLALADAPSIIPRSSWGASERMLRADPYYADRLRLALVHHTAGKTPATPGESAAIVAAIQRFHVQANGWNDIGYNFLVDPFGQIFEGRAGGVESNVVGAHSRGFNTGSVGIALIGDFHTGGAPTPEAIAALTSLLAWRLDIAHLDPATLRSITSGGNGRHPAATPVTLRSVSGHRDADFTSCPGDLLYPQLDGVAAAAAATGLPKLYEPAVEGVVGSLVRITGRLSEDRPWSVTITDPAGALVSQGGAIGSVVDWTWDATAAPVGSYTYAITAGDGVRPASGTVEEPPPPPPVETEPLPVPPPKPKGVPRRIPGWAWKMYRWHEKPRASRGPRPRAPRRLPRWYWKWRRWRRQHARIAELIRIRRDAGGA